MNTSSRVDQLQAYLAADPANSSLACDLVDAMLAESRFHEADDLIARLPVSVQATTGMQFRKARCALVLGRYDEAANDLRDLIARGNDSIALWHDLAFCQLCQRDTGAARATLDQAISRYGDDAELEVLQGRVAAMAGDDEFALAALSKALKLSPNHPAAMGVRALTLLDAGQTEAAASAAAQCLAAHPDQHEALLTAGTIELWQRNLPTALVHFQRVLARHPNSGRALSGHGQLLMLQGRLAEARQQLESAVTAMPDHIGTWHALAWVQLLETDVVGAEYSYQRAYEIDRNFGETHGGFALLMVLNGWRDEAERAIRRALRLDSKSITGRYAHSLWLEDCGRQDEADAVLQELLAQGSLPSGMGVKDFSRRLRERITHKNSAV